jgi:hypothetical protein
LKLNSRWAACVPAAHLESLAALRLFPRIEFAAAGNFAWIRGASIDADLERLLNKVPGLQRFDWLPNHLLRPLGSRIADKSLPALQWRPLQGALPVTLPTPALSGEAKQKLPLCLVRTSLETRPSALLTSLEAWSRFSTTAPLVRLAGLRFAVTDAGQVLTLGTPLPSAPGTQLANFKGILVPCGFTWTPAVDAAVLRQLFQLTGEDVVLLAEDNTAQLIRSEQWVLASRSATRATLSEISRA